MLPPAPVPPAIAEPTGVYRRLEGTRRHEVTEVEEEDDDEFKDVSEPEDEAPEVKHRGPVWKFRPDENVSEETLNKYNLIPPSVMKDRPEGEKEEIKEKLRIEKRKLTKKINELKKEGGDSSVLGKNAKNAKRIR